jgi:tetraacyldisaccharide 4'-kinase
MLARALTGVPVFVSPDRYLAGTLAERKFGCTVHILDDGFQHLQLARDVDVVVMARADLDDKVLPSGRLREPIDALRVADAVLVAGSDEDVGVVGRSVLGLVGPVQLDPRASNPRVANVLRIVPEYGEPFRLKAEATTEENVASGFSRKGMRVVAVAGIARPQRFFDALRAKGFDVVREIAFRDHHWFSAKDIERVERAKANGGAEAIITTEKDAARLGSTPWQHLPMTVSIEPRDSFAVWLYRRLAVARGESGARPPKRGEGWVA